MYRLNWHAWCNTQACGSMRQWRLPRSSFDYESQQSGSRGRRKGFPSVDLLGVEREAEVDHEGRSTEYDAPDTGVLNKSYCSNAGPSSVLTIATQHRCAHPLLCRIWIPGLSNIAPGHGVSYSRGGHSESPDLKLANATMVSTDRMIQPEARMRECSSQLGVEHHT